MSSSRKDSSQNEAAAQFERILSSMMRGASSSDDNDVELTTTIREAREPLEQLCSNVVRVVPQLRDIQSSMPIFFKNTSFVQETLGEEGRSLSFLPRTHQGGAHVLSYFTKGYLDIAAHYKTYVEGKLDGDAPEQSRHNADDYENMIRTKKERETALRHANAILKASFGLYLKA